jgi:predicted ATPase
LRRLIRDRTGGNPFFVEEVVQSLLDHGVLTPPTPAQAADDGARPAKSAALRLSQPIDDLSIPATVQALLAARLDRIPGGHKLVLQAASVIGRTFSPVVLRHVLFSQTAPPPGAPEALAAPAIDAALAALEGADFIRKDGSDPDGEYAFKHPLTQAVTYGSQLVESRARFHVAVARALQSLHGDHLGQYAALLAHHFGAANWKFEASRWRRRASLRVTSIELGRQRR